MIKDKQYLGENLIFIISSTRSGSTLLQRILASHSKICTYPEPHILTPLAYQGFYYKIDKAGYNHRAATKALTAFVNDLPNKEEDYDDACREYCRVLYSRVMENTQKTYFVDKTPNYADTIIPFVEKLFPKAKFIVLTRHPIAILSSGAWFKFDGNYDKSYYYSSRLGKFISEIARFLRSHKVKLLKVRYESLVTNPEKTTEIIFKFLDLPYESECIEYGKKKHINGVGDTKVRHHKRPVTTSVEAWVDDILNDSSKEKIVDKILTPISDEDLNEFGYPRKTIWDPLTKAQENNPNRKTGFRFNQLPHRIGWRIIWGIKHFAKKPTIKKMIIKFSRQLDGLVR